jgi:putative transposase
MITEHRESLGTRALCEALGEPRSSWYRAASAVRNETDARGRAPSHRKLLEDEERHIHAILNSDRFVDLAPAEVFAILLDEGTYYCSERTMYRILGRYGETTERRQHPSRTYARPELLATGPNQVWSWDITKLRSAQKWKYYYLYKMMDIFSRYVVGWLLAHEESAELAEDLIVASCQKQAIEPDQLTLHADGGPSMTAKTVKQLLVDLRVQESHSRPYISNDNPFSESAFKTLKYRPDFPGRFSSIEEARAYCQSFFSWYNTEHRHAGIVMLTPEVVHYGREQSILAERQRVLDEAFARHPERFVAGRPNVPTLPTAVYINPPTLPRSADTPLVTLATPADTSTLFIRH